VLSLFERERSGKGQVVDAAMIDGTAHLSSFMHEYRKAGFWSDERGTNMLDGAAHFYNTYACLDADPDDGSGYYSVGAIEPQFYKKLLECMAIDRKSVPDQLDQSSWPEMRERFAAVFKTKTRAEWETVFNAVPDACAAPVLTTEEVALHPHNKARGTYFLDDEGNPHANPAPRLSATPGVASRDEPTYGQHTQAVLSEVGLGAEELRSLRECGAIAPMEKQSKL